MFEIRSLKQVNDSCAGYNQTLWKNEPNVDVEDFEISEVIEQAKI